MLTEQRLKTWLGQVEGATDVIVGRDGSKFVAIVVSPAYEGKDEDERQSEAWGLLLENLPDEEHSQVSFVTEEKAQAERDAGAASG